MTIMVLRLIQGSTCQRTDSPGESFSERVGVQLLEWKMAPSLHQVADFLLFLDRAYWHKSNNDLKLLVWFLSGSKRLRRLCPNWDYFTHFDWKTFRMMASRESLSSPAMPSWSGVTKTTGSLVDLRSSVFGLVRNRRPQITIVLSFPGQAVDQLEFVFFVKEYST